ncbi:MAG: type ISP restriction/modification enzyme [Myxococcota bacterium]|nr:type ISP restriction/modification enzyme [Myxococcota bacterium]
MTDSRQATARRIGRGLARTALRVRQRIEDAYDQGRRSPSNPWNVLFEDWRIPLGLSDEAAFFDACAQTITYGQFAARWATQRQGADPLIGIDASGLPHMSPVLIHFHQCLLGVVDTGEFAADFEVSMRDTHPDESASVDRLDIIIQVFEHFLAVYDANTRKAHGVYYTPQPVVRAMVRHAHESLQVHFKLPDGLASTVTWGDVRRRMALSRSEAMADDDLFIRILDPAMGTGTFLVETVRLVHSIFIEKKRALHWSDDEFARRWSDHVRHSLLPNMVGHELMVAPFIAAHMILTLVLHETGFQWRTSDELRVYLTNALVPEDCEPQQRQSLSNWVGHPRETLAQMKRAGGFTVVLGNPPYRESSSNKHRYIEALMDRYKATIRHEEVQIKALSNDYLKFIRLGHAYLERSGAGVMTMVTANAYVNGILFRDVRQAWLDSFDEIYIVDLHGSGRRGDSNLEDENVFEILQGVAVCHLVRSVGRGTQSIHTANLRGLRTDKFRRLATTTLRGLAGETSRPVAPRLAFNPLDETDTLQRFTLPDIFGTGDMKSDRNRRWGGGFKTRQDRFTVGFSIDELQLRIAELAHIEADEVQLRDKYRLCKTAHFDFGKAHAAACRGELVSAIRRALYRPFDPRFLIWHRTVLCEPQTAVSRHFDHENLCLISSRLVTDDAYRHVSVARGPVDVIYLSNSTSTNAYVFPLYAYSRSASGQSTRRINLSPEFQRTLTETYGRLVVDDQDATPSDISASHVLDYVFGMLQSEGFRRRYGERLKVGFPAIPIPKTYVMFEAIARIGARLVTLYQRPTFEAGQGLGVRLVGEERRVSRGRPYPTWSARQVQLNQTTYIADVSEAAWRFRVGKYQVLHKWLRDRRGRELTNEDLNAYSEIVGAIEEIIVIRPHLDQAIAQHGGWSSAFLMTD